MDRCLSAGLLLIVCWMPSPAIGQDSPNDRNLVPQTQASGVAGAESMPRRWAFIIGIDGYLDAAIPQLRYCRADTELMARTLVEHCDYQATDVVVMNEKSRAHLLPLAANIKKQLIRGLQQVRSGDSVLIYFSGHGMLTKEGVGYLAPLDCKLDELQATSIALRDLRRWLNDCAAKRKVLVLDCCHAGAEKNIRNNRPFGESPHKLAAVFRDAQGLLTLGSCSARELSLEWDHVKHGLFTYFLAKALQGEADLDGDGFVDSDEAYKYVYENVRSTAKNEFGRSQRPVRELPKIGVFQLARNVVRRATGASLRLYQFEKQDARGLYERPGAGRLVATLADKSLGWAPKNAIFIADKNMGAALSRANLAGLWSGVWEAPSSGEYLFTFQSVGHGWNKGGCCLQVDIGNKPVLRSVFGVFGLGKRSGACVRMVELEQGPNPVRIWRSTTGVYDDVAPIIQFREPGASKFKVLTPAMLTH